MKKSVFLLKESRDLLISKNASATKTPNRRTFLKTLGLTALAANPALGTVKKWAENPFTVEYDHNRMKVWRNGVLAWDISQEHFSPSTNVLIESVENGWLFQIENFNLKNTLIQFNLSGQIVENLGHWVLKMESNELQLSGETDFEDFLDGVKPLTANSLINSNVITLQNGGKVALNGTYETAIMPDWSLQFSKGDRVQIDVLGNTYHSHSLKVIPGFNGKIPFYDEPLNGSILEFDMFTDWEKFIASYHYKGKNNIQSLALNPTLHILSGENHTAAKQFLWTEAKGNQLLVKNIVKDPIELKDYFFFQDFSEKESPFYLSARLTPKGQWLTNNIGSFKLIRNSEFPDFELFGSGIFIQYQTLSPRLKAFHPKLKNGLATTTVFSNPQVVHVTDSKATGNELKTSYFFEPPQDTTRNKTIKKTTIPIRTVKKTPVPEKKEEVKPVREVKVDEKEPTINVTKDIQRANNPEIIVDDIRKVKFVPRLPMSIRILRPEDLVWLDVQFKNFKFSSRSGATMVELDDKSKPGIITYSFPTQHTLEEAYFETTPMDVDGNQAVTLPARHIRAKKSRLVYEYDAGKPAFELTIQELLDWSKFTLKVHPRAYIKLPAPPVKFATRPTTVSKANLINTQNLNVKNNFYKTRIVEKSKNRADKFSVYDKSVVSAVVTDKVSPTLEPSFNISTLKLPLKVEPIPDTHTSIEAPALMYISPNQVTDFTHKTLVEYRDTEEIPEIKSNTTIKQIRPVNRIQLNPLYTNKGQITELWHTTLGIKLKNNKVAYHGMDKLKTIRALWAFDANPDYKGCALIDDPFQASLDASDRHKLVHTTSNYEIQGFTPIPVPVKKLMLTGLGAYLDWHAFFDVPTPVDNHLNIIEWEHLATLGRDHYVKVVREGYLFPLGHRAALVKVTERKFDLDTKAAVNKMRMYIVILEKEVLYQRNDPANRFIKFPFQAVTIENQYTPNINKPEQIDLNIGKIPRLQLPGSTDCPQKPGRSSTYNFYIHVNSKPFLFDITAVDKEGNEHRIQMPLAFVENATGRSKIAVEKMVENYNPKKNLNEIPFNGQQVAYAEALVDGDTAFETKKFTFGGQYYPATGTGDLKFHPIMQSADVYIKAVDELTGKHEPANIQLEDDSNKGMVFAKVTGAEVDFSGGSDKSGGFMMPNMSISGLSKLQGPIGGNIQKMMNLEFIPTDFFNIIGDLPLPKIFGVIQITDLLGIPDLGGSTQNFVSQIKKIKEDIEKIKDDLLVLKEEAKEKGDAVKAAIEDKKAQLKNKAKEVLDILNNQIPKVPNLKTWFTTEAFYVEYKWIPEFLKSDISLFGILNFHVDKPKEALQITTTFSKPFDGLTSATLDGKAQLSKFSVEIKDALKVNFNEMKFVTGSSKKTDIKVDLDKTLPIEFVGALSFVNNLQSLIPSTGFSDDGPYVNLTLAGVKAGFNISIPDVEVGVFALSNMTLGAYVNLPFNGDELTVGFNFCTRENPFLLTVSGFGGGGYFLMITTLRGLKSVEAAFEFGAAVSLNLGVASGGVSIMGGFYFKYELVKSDDGDKEMINLTGYIRINGRMSILGIISVSLEFYLALNAVYETVHDKLKVTKMEGVATLKVKIEILFFSKTVSVTVRREFAGADADPTFGEMVLPEDWNEYCLAFA